MLLVDFAGLAPRDSLSTLRGPDIHRVDPLCHDYTARDGLAKLASSCASRMSHGEAIVAYCAGAAFAAKVAQAARELGRQPKLVLIDPTPIGRADAIELILTAWQAYWPDRATAGVEVGSLTARTPEHAAADALRLLTPLMRKRLEKLGIGREAIDDTVGELAERHAAWISFLLWTCAVSSSTEILTHAYVLIADPDRISSIHDSGVPQGYVNVEVDPGRYLADTPVEVAIRAAVRGAQRETAFTEG